MLPQFSVSASQSALLQHLVEKGTAAQVGPDGSGSV